MMAPQVQPQDPVRIEWQASVESHHPHAAVSPAAESFAPVGFPPPWPNRPWIYANLIASRNGIVGWTPKAPRDHAVRAIVGPHASRPARLADRQFMAYLRACADAVGVGGQTLRDEPDLIETPGALTRALGPTLKKHSRMQRRWLK